MHRCPGARSFTRRPTLLAEFDADSGWLGVSEAVEAAGEVARYVGVEYDERRWRFLDPDEYRIALLAGAACASCWPAASAALADVTRVQRRPLRGTT